MSIQKQTILIALTSGLVGVILTVFLIFFLGGKIKDNSDKIIEIRKEIIISQGESGDVSQIKREFGKIKPNLDKIDNLFVDSEAPVKFIEFLEKTAARTNAVIEINPSAVKEESVWEGIGFQLRITGSPDSCLRFLDKLESSFYLTKIGSVSISKIEEESLRSDRYKDFLPGDLILNIKLEAFTKNENN